MKTAERMREDAVLPERISRLWLSAIVFGLLILTVSSVAVLWPLGAEGEQTVPLGKIEPLQALLEREGRPLYHSEGDFFVVPYTPKGPDDPYVEAGVAHHGVMVLSAASPRLPDTIYYCPSSRWFETVFDGSKFNRIGELQPGSPAPAGLWRHPFRVDRFGNVVVIIGERVAQPPFGQDTLREPPAGEHCAGAPEDRGAFPLDRFVGGT